MDNWLEEEFQRLVRRYKVKKGGNVSPRPWTFKHEPILGAIENHQIRSANGLFVGSVYSYADAKLICDLANKKSA